MKVPSFSEGSWLGAFVIAVGAIGGILGIAFLFWPQPPILLGIAAGSGWTLVVALFVVNGMNRARITDLETQLAVSRNQADAWSAAAADASAASRAVAELFRPQSPAPTPRKRKSGD